MSDIELKLQELVDSIYAPKFCKHCNKVQPVYTWILQGSEKLTFVGTVGRITYTGSHACTVCFKEIEEPNE